MSVCVDTHVCVTVVVVNDYDDDHVVVTNKTFLALENLYIIKRVSVWVDVKRECTLRFQGQTTKYCSETYSYYLQPIATYNKFAIIFLVTFLYQHLLELNGLQLYHNCHKPMSLNKLASRTGPNDHTSELHAIHGLRIQPVTLSWSWMLHVKILTKFAVLQIKVIKRIWRRCPWACLQGCRKERNCEIGSTKYNGSGSNASSSEPLSSLFLLSPHLTSHLCRTGFQAIRHSEKSWAFYSFCN